MAKIKVTLTHDDIEAACLRWATTRVLNEGSAENCVFTVQPLKDGALVQAEIDVVTGWMHGE